MRASKFDYIGEEFVVADVVLPVAEDDPEHAARVDAFQIAVREQAGRPEGRISIVRRFITTGPPVGLHTNAYYRLRSEGASLYDLHPSAVVVVGSCRTGFSISKKEFKPRYRPFNQDSDIDVAVVSASLFDRFWEAVLAGLPSPDWAISAIGTKGHREQPHHLARDVFNGCVIPERLIAVRSVEQASEWVKKFDEISRSRAYGNLKVRGRLYRTWTRLESYQSIMVTECNAELTGGIQ